MAYLILTTFYVGLVVKFLLKLIDTGRSFLSVVLFMNDALIVTAFGATGI